MKRYLRIASVLTTISLNLGFGEEPESGWEIGQWEDFYNLRGDLFADEDGDGISNFVEFGFGLNPLEKQNGDEFSPELSIRTNVDKDIELSLWQPELQLDLLGEGAYGRQWFSISVQSTEDGDKWTTIADKIGVGFFWGTNQVEVSAEKQENGRFKIRIVDRRPNLESKPRLYRMAFFLVS